MSKKEMTTEKRLKVRLYLSLLIYTVVGYGLTLILDYIFSKFDNDIFAWIYWRLGPLFILYLVIGFVCIFNYYWKKPWDYLDEVIDATQTVYEQNSHTVSLSDPLKELEEQLNQIKMSVLLSKQAAKQAEEKKNEIVMTGSVCDHLIHIHICAGSGTTLNGIYDKFLSQFSCDHFITGSDNGICIILRKKPCIIISDSCCFFNLCQVPDKYRMKLCTCNRKILFCP